MSKRTSLHGCKPLLILAYALGLVRLSSAFEGVIDPATVAITERLRFEARVPGTVAISQHQAFSMNAAGEFFTGSGVRGPGTNLPDFQVIPLPSSAIRKFSADASLLWLRLREVHVVTDASTGVSSAFERHSPEQEEVQIPMDERWSDQVTHVLATRDGGVVVAADLYEPSVENYEGTNGSTGRREFPARLGRTLYRKFDAAGNLVWRRMTFTDSELVQPTTTLELREMLDGSIATLARSTTFSGSSLGNRAFNQQTIVRVLSSGTGELVWQEIFGGDAAADFKDSAPLALELDAQDRLYVLSREQTSVFTPDAALTRNVVRRIEASDSGVALLELFETNNGATERWRLLAVDGAGNFHVAGISQAAPVDMVPGEQRAVVSKFGTDLARQWRSEGPVPPKLQVYHAAVEPTGLHLSAQGVTVVGITTAVANDGYNIEQRGETMRFTPEGVLAWHRYLEAEAGDDFYGKKLELNFSKVDADGNVYVAGSQTTATATVPNLAKYSSTGLLQFVRLLEANIRHSHLTIAPNGRPTTLSALTDTGGTSVVLEFANPAVKLTPPLSVQITKPLLGAALPFPAAVTYSASVTTSAPAVPLKEVIFFVDGAIVASRSSEPYSVTVDNPGAGAHTLVVKARVRNLGDIESEPVQFVVNGSVVPPTLSTLTVNIGGPADSGTVTAGFLGATTRVNAKVYTVTAKAKPGFLFTGWSGGVNSTDRVLRFVMTPDLTLTADFAPNPFLVARGTYTGLGDRITSSGVPSALFSATVEPGGAFSARLTLGKARVNFRGLFDIAGNFAAQFTIARRSVVVDLHLDLTNGTKSVAGTVTVAGVTYEVDGDRRVFSAENPAPQAGLYTFILPAPGGFGVPIGDSWFTASIEPNGRTMISGALADGTRVVRSGTLGADGSFALYASLYSAKGVLASDLKFAPVADLVASDVIASMLWQKPAVGPAVAFSVEGNVIGSLYARPADTGNVFGALGNVQVQFSTTPAIPDVTASLAANGRGSSAAAGFTLEFDNASGTFTGRAPQPLRNATYQAVLLRKQQVARGFVKGEALGRVSIAPAP